jgi:hypothetical protein
MRKSFLVTIHFNAEFSTCVILFDRNILHLVDSSSPLLTFQSMNPETRLMRVLHSYITLGAVLDFTPILKSVPMGTKLYSWYTRLYRRWNSNTFANSPIVTIICFLWKANWSSFTPTLQMPSLKVFIRRWSLYSCVSNIKHNSAPRM